MQKITAMCTEEQMQLIQQITHASRQDVLYTIRTSRISAGAILEYLKNLSSSRQKNLQTTW